MEPIELNVNGGIFTAIPKENNTFDIMENGVLLGNIFADHGINTELVWSSGDLITNEFVQAVGEAIERQEK